MSIRLAGNRMPTVLVTSANRGIGREFVRQYAADGWHVLAACRNPAEVADELRAMGSEVRPIAMDVTDLASVEAVAREDTGPLDLLVNSAGVIGEERRSAASSSGWSSGRSARCPNACSSWPGHAAAKTTGASAGRLPRVFWPACSSASSFQ
jgi:NAD(P)-dependent dehydrogenase (short-subunit alcohol dehydrogenase family)